MISLRDLQRDFLGYTLGDTDVGERLGIVANGLTTDQRLRIYRNNAVVGFEKSMQATFPAFVRLGGVDWFNQMARAYQPKDLDRLSLHLQEDLSQLRFRVAAPTRAIESNYALFEIWNQNRSEREQFAPIDLRRGASRVLVIRRIDHVEVREVSAPVFTLLRGFAAGSTVLERLPPSPKRTATSISATH